MKHRYRFIGQRIGEGTWTITASEAFHMLKVLRLNCGEEAEITDGAGGWAVGTISELSTKHAVITAENEGREDPPATHNALALGALRRGFIDELLPSLTELGILHIHVFGQEGVRKEAGNAKDLERWEKILQGAIKQSKSCFLPTIHFWPDLSKLLSSIKGKYPVRCTLAAEATQSLPIALQHHGNAFAVLGGERGLSDVECALLRKEGFNEASLGPRTLRAFTAAIACATVMALRA